MSELARLPVEATAFLAPFLPANAPADRPFVTLTYATSLDSTLSLSPGVQTALSGSASKALTHHLRTHHDAILIGVSTATADDPGLNSRLAETPLSSQPRPIILDPHFRWPLTRDSRVLRTARENKGKAPYIFVSRGEYRDGDPRVDWVNEAGGQVVQLDGAAWKWQYLLGVLKELGLNSLMVEGGVRVINDLLQAENVGFLDTVIVTIAPVYLGQGGVEVKPERAEKERPAVKFRDVKWDVLGRDVVMAARPDA